MKRKLTLLERLRFWWNCDYPSCCCPHCCGYCRQFYLYPESL